jgi:nucleotide-binding universal stress UspA family protein
MYNHILLCTDGSPAADIAADHALWLAERLAARIEVLYVTDIRILEGPWLADFAGAVGAQPYAALVPQIEQIQKEKADTILNAIRAKCAARNIPNEIYHETGNLVPIVLQHEHRADLVVIGQRGEHAPWNLGMLGSSVERVVRASIKPALVTADSFRPIQRILIAHDGSNASRKALNDGLDLAGHLKAAVTLLTACHPSTEETAATFLREARQLAEQRNLKPHIQLVHGDPEIEILHNAHEIGADLVVMGAYGHTRIREFVLGSTTHHVIRKTTLPVLLVRGA